MSDENKGRLLHEQEVQCPHCRKHMTVSHVKRVIEKPVKGEYEDVIKIEPSKQSRIPDHVKKEAKKK